MLSVRCLSALSVLSVTLVYCGQTVGRIMMKLGMQVGLGPGQIALDGDKALPPPKGGGVPQFSTYICCGQMAAWIKMPTGVEIGLGPGDFVLDRHPSPPPKKDGGAPCKFSYFRPIFIVAKRRDGSRWYLAQR